MTQKRLLTCLRHHCQAPWNYPAMSRHCIRATILISTRVCATSAETLIFWRCFAAWICATNFIPERNQAFAIFFATIYLVRHAAGNNVELRHELQRLHCLLFFPPSAPPSRAHSRHQSSLPVFRLVHCESSQ